ncbi:MAG: SusE domain-containing protein [Prevotella sp.]|nr:SusE domain-containing protein [Prevotella sp.]
MRNGLFLAMAAMLFNACDTDRDDNPVIGPDNAPTEFVLNTPAMSEQFIQLSADNKVNLTWSQPNYVYNAIATYEIQVGVVDNDNVKWLTDENGNPIYLDTSFNECNVNISGDEIAEAICKIDGFGTPEEYVDKGAREIAMRVRSTIRNASNEVMPGTEIVSNPITFKHMAAYNAVKGIGTIWIIGNCSGWKEPSAANAEALEPWIVYETEIGSKVYYGVYDIPEGDLEFRFYTKLTGWDGGASIGHQEADQSTEVSFSGNSFTDKYVSPGKGSWKFVGFPGGKLAVTVDMNAQTVKFEITE